MFVRSVRMDPENSEALKPQAGKKASTFGRLTIVQALMNPDLFPDPTPEQRERVGDAANTRRLVELRDGWLNPPGLDPADLAKRTLTNLYSRRRTWLSNAHAHLDAAILAAYDWRPDLPDPVILERLLAVNHERAERPTVLTPGIRLN